MMKTHIKLLTLVKAIFAHIFVQIIAKVVLWEYVISVTEDSN